MYFSFITLFASLVFEEADLGNETQKQIPFRHMILDGRVDNDFIFHCDKGIIENSLGSPGNQIRSRNSICR
jgi:hypothetical protein